MTISHENPTSLFGRRMVVLPQAHPMQSVVRLSAVERSLAREISEECGEVLPGREEFVADAARELAAVAASCDLGCPFTPTPAGFVVHDEERASRAPRRTARYLVGCVASIVVAGRGEVVEHAEHDRGVVVGRYRVGPGDIVLRRGWSPLGLADPRPYVRVTLAGGSLVLFETAENLVHVPELESWLGLLTRAEVVEARSGLGDARNAVPACVQRLVDG